MITSTYLAGMVSDYVAVKEALGSLENKLISAFAYKDKAELFDGFDLKTLENFKQLENEFMAGYLKFIADEITDKF